MFEFPSWLPTDFLNRPIFPFVMVVCCNKVMGVAVVLQIEQRKKKKKKTREEIGDMERNKREETVMGSGMEVRGTHQQ